MEEEQSYCTNCGNSVAEQRQSFACMSCGARPFGHKKFCFQCGVKLNPEQVVCIKCGVGLIDHFGAAGASPADTIDKLNTYFKVFWILMVVGLPLCLIVIGLIPLIISIVYCCMLHYQLWKLISKEIARTTPGKAVGFQFIPFFNFYWYFVTYYGLCQDMNDTLVRRGIQCQVSEGLGMTYAILSVICWLTLFDPSGIIALSVGVATCIVSILFYKDVKSGAIALLKQEDSSGSISLLTRWDPNATENRLNTC